MRPRSRSAPPGGGTGTSEPNQPWLDRDRRPPNGPREVEVRRRGERNDADADEQIREDEGPAHRADVVGVAPGLAALEVGLLRESARRDPETSSEAHEAHRA